MLVSHGAGWLFLRGWLERAGKPGCFRPSLYKHQWFELDGSSSACIKYLLWQFLDWNFVVNNRKLFLRRMQLQYLYHIQPADDFARWHNVDVANDAHIAGFLFLNLFFAHGRRGRHGVVLRCGTCSRGWWRCHCDLSRWVYVDTPDACGRTELGRSSWERTADLLVGVI